MASFAFDSYWDDLFKNNVDPNVDTVYCMLLTASASPVKNSWAKRSDVTNECPATGGYVAGGFAVTVSIAEDTTNNIETYNLGGMTINNATIDAAYALYYVRRGGLASADNLIAVIDLGGHIISTNGPWVLTASKVNLQN